MESLIIRLPHLETDRAEWVVTAKDGVVIKPAAVEPLAMISPHAKSRHVIVIIPGADVLLTYAKVPTTRIAQARSAIPYALEEYLSEDISALHFALGTADTENKYPVAIIQQEKIQQWLSKLQDADLFPDQLIPDIYGLPLVEHAYSMIFVDAQTLIRCNLELGFTIEQDNLNMILTRKIAEFETDLPEKIVIFNHGLQNLSEDLYKQVSSIKNIEITVEQMGQPLIEVFAKTLSRIAAPINLLQGSLRPHYRISKLQRVWGFTAILGLIWLTLQFISNGIGYFYLSYEENILQQKVAVLYHEVFPQATEVISPKIRLQQKLASVHQQQTDNGFLDLLAKVGQLLHENNNITLTNLSYQNHQLSLQIKTVDYKSLQNFGTVLTNTGLQVKQNSGKSDGNMVVAEFLISERT